MRDGKWMVNTRGNRQTLGGNDFSTAYPAWALTEKARSWKVNNSIQLTIQEASVLQSFPVNYPWRGSRSKQFQQVGNAIPPLLALAIIRALHN